ncbi:MAG: hypothetical protein IKK84_04570 [Clostridia bacterium]|nr:hypothetical protein [Clostridia bacterium]
MEEKGKVYSGLKRRNKFLGIIDYRTLVILLGYVWIVWKIAENIFNSLIYRGYFCVFLIIPVIGLVYANRNEEDISHIIYVIIKFLVSPKLYVCKLNHKKYWRK